MVLRLVYCRICGNISIKVENEMTIGLDLSFIKTGSLACWIMAVMFTYGAVVYQIYWYIVPVTLLVFIGIFLYRKESEIRKYEADKLVEKSKIEGEAKLNVEREKTNRQGISKFLGWLGKKL